MKSKKIASALLAATVVTTAVPAAAVQAAVTPAETAAKTALDKAKASLTQADLTAAINAANKIADKNVKEWYMQELFIVNKRIAAKDLAAKVEALAKEGKVLDKAEQDKWAAAWSAQITTINNYKGLTAGNKNALLNVFFNEPRRINNVNVIEAYGKAGKATQAQIDKEKAAVNAMVNTTLKNQLLARLNAIKVTYKVEVVSTAAVATNKLEVKFNTAVDTAKADIKVKKAGIVINVTKVTFSEDKKTATLELASKLTQGDYTVLVSGLSDAALTGVVAVQDERVAKIEVLTTEAPLVDLDGTDADDLVIAYRVLNQYGEDITKATTDIQITTNAVATLDAANGKIKLVGNFNVATAKTAIVTLIHVQTATTTTATVTAVSSAKLSTVAVGAVYNKDSKTLDENTDLNKDAFYLLISGKDQYGNAVSAASLESEILVYQSNKTVVDIGVDKDSKVKVAEVEINGAKVPAIKLAGPVSAGANAVTVIAKQTGSNAVVTINVAEGVRSDAVKLYAPELVVAGEDAFVPAEVYDKNGNLIKDATALNGAKGVSLSIEGAAFVSKDNNIFVKIPASKLADSPYVSLVATSKTTYKVASVMLNVKAAAKAVVVRGLDKDFSKSIKKGSSITIGAADLVVEDQYGRTMSDDTFKAWLDKEDTAVKVAAVSSDILKVAATEITKSTETITVSAVDNKKNGSEKLTFSVVGVNGSEGTGTIRVTDGTEYTNYEIGEVGTVYDEVANNKADHKDYDKNFKVYGVLNDGSKVLLAAGVEYTVKSSLVDLAKDAEDGVIDADGYAVGYDKDKNEKTHTVTVTINNTGNEVTKSVTFSKAAPTVASLRAVDKDAKTITSLAIGKSEFAVEDLANSIEVVDQYGAKVTIKDFATAKFADGTGINAPTLTITPVKGTVTISKNGLANASVAGLDAGEEVSVKVNFGSVNSTVVIKK